MKGFLAMLLGVAVTACAAGPGVPQPTPAPTPATSLTAGVDVLGPVQTLHNKGWECGASAFYTNPSEVVFCATTSGIYDEQVRIIHSLGTKLEVSAEVTDAQVSDASTPPADLAEPLFQLVVGSLLRDSTASAASRWLSGRNEDGSTKIAQLHLSLDTSSRRRSLVIDTLPGPDARSPAPLPLTLTDVAREAQGQGLTCPPASATSSIQCLKRGVVITADPAYAASNATPPPAGAVGTLGISVKGPAGPETALAAQAAAVGRNLVHASLAGSAEADHAIAWLAARSDGHAHRMVFGGLELDVTPLGSSSSAIEGVDVEVLPASALSL